ncbi:MAG: alpha/beta hydrolase, partial [Muribaculaceae bacterium]|nr:alpha/beta hydrolase [Muribaculaceae bacterium]
MKLILSLLPAALLLALTPAIKAQNMHDINTDRSLAAPAPLTLATEWDKVLPQSDKVTHPK